MDKKIKLLILCQKVDQDDDLLGFFHSWIAEFAKHCERVTAVCLYKGAYDLPGNVKVLSLGKENKGNAECGMQNAEFFRFKMRIRYLRNFFHFIWRERKNYDKVFVHMNHEYVVLGGWLWKLLGKKIILWHAHKTVNWKLIAAEKFVDAIVTSTKSGCRLDSKKIRVVGQGIDAGKLKVKSEKLKIIDLFKIITVGRISPIKDLETLIRAVEIIARDSSLLALWVEIIGGPGTAEDERYLEKLKSLARQKGLESIVKFVGPVANKDISSYLQSADLFVNTSLTGSLDKAVLEAMAAGLPILTGNEAFLDVLGEYKNDLMFEKGDYEALAQKIKYIMGLGDERRKKMSDDLSKIVECDHSLENLIIKIISQRINESPGESTNPQRIYKF